MKLVKNALIMPLEGTMEEFAGGVFDSGKFVKDSLVEIRGRECAPRPPERKLAGTYIYGGCFFAHFGHFIWESLARLETIRKCREYPVIFISPNDHVFETYKLIFRTIGIRNEIIIAREPTLVEKLIYSPPQSSVSPLFIEDAQLESLACKDFGKSANDCKLWLSRRKLKYGRITNEEDIENELQKAGYEIVFPEKIPLLEQIKLISTSRIVSGFDGSQFYSALFAKNICGEFHVFNRRGGIPAAISHMLEKKGIKNHQHLFNMEMVDYDPSIEKSNAGINYFSRDADKIIEILTAL